MSRGAPLLKAALLATAVLLAACGPASTVAPAPSIPAGATVLDIKEGDLYINPKTTQAAAGPVAFKVVNEAHSAHDLRIQKKGSNSDIGSTPMIDGGSSAVLVVTLAPGTYTLYCGVPGHRSGGMEAELTVT